MSRRYQMSVTIGDFDQEKEQEIIQAAIDVWPCFADDFCEGIMPLSAMGEGSLYGGETEYEFADRLAKAIWKAHGSYCPVEVGCTCLEYIPVESYSRDGKDYVRLTEGGA